MSDTPGTVERLLLCDEGENCLTCADQRAAARAHDAEDARRDAAIRKLREIGDDVAVCLTWFMEQDDPDVEAVEHANAQIGRWVAAIDALEVRP